MLTLEIRPSRRWFDGRVGAPLVGLGIVLLRNDAVSLEVASTALLFNRKSSRLQPPRLALAWNAALADNPQARSSFRYCCSC